jgi:hypothetical protein
VSGATFANIVQNIGDKCDRINDDTIYIDRHSQWIDLIVDHYRGYTIDFEALPKGDSILDSELSFFGIRNSVTSVSVTSDWTRELNDYANNYYLKIGDEALYTRIVDGIYDEDTARKLCESARVVIERSKYKEYITSAFMRIADCGLQFWSDRTHVDTVNLREAIELRLSEDDALLKSLHEFSDTIKMFPFLSWTVDNVRMFLLNYFIKTQSA